MSEPVLRKFRWRYSGKLFAICGGNGYAYSAAEVLTHIEGVMRAKYPDMRWTRTSTGEVIIERMVNNGN